MGATSRIPDEDLGPRWLRDEVSINVRVDGLRNFAKALLEDLEKNFGTHVPQVYDAMSAHACVGDGLFFAEMNQVRTKHYKCLDATVNLLQAYARGTYALGSGADTVADKYDDADELAKAKAQDVERIMNPPTTGQTTHATSSNATHLDSTGATAPAATTTADPQIVDRGTQ
jgi:hypothetical protein